MRAARLHAVRRIQIDEVPTPEAGPGEVLVQVRAVSVCPSDVRLFEDGHASGVVPDHPFTQGHEFAGDVAALGRGVEGPPVGTPVAVEPSWSCGRCDMCRRSLPNLCRNIIFPSFPQCDGALAEYIACPAESVCPLPEGVDYVRGALIEPLGVALHAVRLATLHPEDSIAVLGAGTIGMCVMQVARAHGIAHVAVVEPIPGRRVWPQQLGADVVAPSYEDLRRAHYEADVVLECSGNNAALDEALQVVRPAGKVIVVGIPHPARVCFDSTVPRRHELTIIFSRRSRETLEEGLRLLGEGRINLRDLPVRTYALEQTQEAMEATAAQPGDMLRAIVIP